MSLDRLNLSTQKLQTFCKKWRIIEFSIFGSALRDDFRPDSDLDVLVSFMPHAPWTIVDLITIQNELQQIVNRDVDLIEKRVIEKSHNSIRRNEILTTAQILYSQVHEPA
ncbi:MAG: nucleotidyltransferase [Synechococcales cyanobacterium CRU_2_2]|nr:nucleotidyltransferase [Synechococcales cyanobacterium CRU_2_2]